jgi:hypothetical protein
MLAVYSGSGGTAASLRIAWFEPAGQGAWAAWGWQGATEAEAAAYLRWFYQDDEMFAHASGLADMDWEGVEPAGEPVPLRYGFDEADPFQPVLDAVQPGVAEAMVEVGAAALPVLAPMAIPAAEGGGRWTLACLTGELADQFGEFSEVTGITNDGGGGGGGECGSGPEDKRCKYTSTTYTFGPNCSPWSGWSVQQKPNGTRYCRRIRDCRSHTRTIIIHTDCRVEQMPDEYGPWVPQVGEKPVNAQGLCDP